MAGTFHCSLVTPQRQVFDGEVTYASVPAWDGQVGIAPMRAPLLVKLGHGSLRLDAAQGASRWFFIGGGFAQMVDNRLTLLTQEALPAEELTRQQASAEFDRAMQQPARGDEEVEQKHVQVERARAMVHLTEQVGNRA